MKKNLSRKKHHYRYSGPFIVLSRNENGSFQLGIKGNVLVFEQVGITNLKKTNLSENSLITKEKFEEDELKLKDLDKEENPVDTSDKEFEGNEYESESQSEDKDEEEEF